MPPPKGSMSRWLESLVGDAAPCVAVKLEDGVGVIIPKLKPVPDGANEKSLPHWLVADGVEVTGVSVFATPGPEAFSAGDS